MKRGEIAHHITRGAFYLAIEKGAALVSGIAYFALLLRWLGPTKYGIITLAFSFTGLATTARGNLELYLERYAAEFDAQGRLATLRRAHRIALGIKFALGILSALVVVALAPTLARSFATPELGYLLPILSLVIVCDGLATTGRATLYGLQRFRAISVLSLGFHVAKTVMVGALWGAKQGLPALAIGLVVLTIAQALVSSALPAWMLRNARDRAPDPGEPAQASGLLRSMIAYCAPLLGARVAFLSGQNLGKIVLGKLFTTTELGYFSFAFQTVERFIDMLSTLPAALLPSLTRLVTRQERERLQLVFDQAFRLIQVASVVLAFSLFVFAPEVTLLVGSPLFLPAVPLLRILALVPIARTAQQPMNLLFQAMGFPGLVFRLALVKLAVEIVGYLALVTTLGTLGAGIASLAGAVAACVVAQAMLRKLLPEGADDRRRAAVTAGLALTPFLVVALLCDRYAGGPVSTSIKVLLIPIAAVTLFAFGLVTRYDLQKLSELPLRAQWMRLARDSVVAAGDRLASAVAGRRAS